MAGWLFLIVATLGISRGGGDLSLPALAAEQQSQLQAADITRSAAQLGVTRENSGTFDPQPSSRLFTDDAPEAYGTDDPQQDAPASATPEPAPTTDETDPTDFSTALGVSQHHEPTPIFRMHEVSEGETVSEIAERYGVTTNDVVWNNAGVLDDADMLVVGAILQIPGVSGVIHSVLLGETVSEIAMLYDAEIEDIVAFEANEFQGDADNVVEGSMILVPGGRVIPPEPEPAPQVPDWVAAQSPSSSGAQERPEGGSSAQEGAPAVQEPEPQPAQEPPPAAQPAPPSWQWPAQGRLTSRFGPRHPLGIDISMVVNTPIVAAYPGQVVFVGGNACCSYGYHIIIKHEDGVETRYAHLSKFEVSNGDWVDAGQLIGRSGNTGYSTGPHLHFEIRRNGTPRDPFGFLP